MRDPVGQDSVTPEVTVMLFLIVQFLSIPIEARGRRTLSYPG